MFLQRMTATQLSQEAGCCREKTAPWYAIDIEHGKVESGEEQTLFLFPLLSKLEK